MSVQVVLCHSATSHYLVYKLIRSATIAYRSQTPYRQSSVSSFKILSEFSVIIYLDRHVRVKGSAIVKHARQTSGVGDIPPGHVRVESSAAVKHLRKIGGFGDIPTGHIRVEGSATAKHARQNGGVGDIPTGHIRVKGSATVKHARQPGGSGDIPTRHI